MTTPAKNTQAAKAADEQPEKVKLIAPTSTLARS